MFRRLLPSWLYGGGSDGGGDKDGGGGGGGGFGGRGGSRKGSDSRRRKGNKTSTVSATAATATATAAGERHGSSNYNSSSSSDHQGDQGVVTPPSQAQQQDMTEPELEIISLSPDQKQLLKQSWQIIYSKMGHTLCYVGDDHPGGGGGGGGGDGEGGGEGGVGGGGVAETFLRLFEEYPKSQEFFSRFRDTPVDSLRNDVRLSRALQEHAVRVMQVVEKVVGRIDSIEKSTSYLLNLGKFHRLSGIPSDYFGVMGTIFLHAVRPYLKDSDSWNEATEDVWMELFGHIARVMTHGHKYFHVSKEETTAATSSSTTTTGKKLGRRIFMKL